MDGYMARWTDRFRQTDRQTGRQARQAKKTLKPPKPKIPNPSTPTPKTSNHQNLNLYYAKPDLPDLLWNKVGLHNPNCTCTCSTGP